MAKMQNFSYVPFAAGPRNCIGQNLAMHEMKVTTILLLRQFVLEIPPGAPEPRADPNVVLRAENGIQVLFRRRE